MREKPNSLLTKINDIKQVVASAENYSIKRMLLVFKNTEFRLKEIKLIESKYHDKLEQITQDCVIKLDSSPKESFDNYKSSLGDLLECIINDSNQVFTPAI